MESTLPTNKRKREGIVERKEIEAAHRRTRKAETVAIHAQQRADLLQLQVVRAREKAADLTTHAEILGSISRGLRQRATCHPSLNYSVNKPFSENWDLWAQKFYPSQFHDPTHATDDASDDASDASEASDDPTEASVHEADLAAFLIP